MGKDVADILIIGSGASGGPCAWHLSAIPGIKIVCLEQGDWARRSGATPSAESDAERQRRTARAPRAGVNYTPNGYPYDHTEASGWQPILGMAVGGGTLHYGASWHRFHPSDFKARSLEGVAEDWPINYWDLAPYYDWIDRIVGIAGLPGNPAYPPTAVEFQPPYRFSKAAEALMRGFKKLGWHHWPKHKAILTRPLRGRKPCPTYCATCVDGCSHEAKNSADVVFLPEAIGNGLVLKPRARVREIMVNKRGLADGALYYDVEGRLHEQKARLVIVACGGIGTPHLLLNSKSSRFPHGLANSSGQVGKNLMCHPSAGATGQFEENLYERDPLFSGVVSDQLYESHPGRGFARGVWLHSGGYNGPMPLGRGSNGRLVALGVDVEDAPAPSATIIRVASRSDARMPHLPWGAMHHVAFQERVSHTASLSAMYNQLPDEANRVELHPRLTDEFGIPAVKLFMRWTDNDRKALAFGVERVKEVLEAAGATKVLTRDRISAPHHTMGTARMGSDPNKAVVDGWGRAHDVKNLFIVDASVFTTGGALVPTCTIHAVALRTADYIKINSRTLL